MSCYQVISCSLEQEIFQIRSLNQFMNILVPPGSKPIPILIIFLAWRLPRSSFKVLNIVSIKHLSHIQSDFNIMCKEYHLSKSVTSVFLLAFTLGNCITLSSSQCFDCLSTGLVSFANANALSVTSFFLHQAF